MKEAKLGYVSKWKVMVSNNWNDSTEVKVGSSVLRGSGRLLLSGKLPVK